MTKILTADFSNFDHYELAIAAELIKQYCENPFILEKDIAISKQFCGCVYMIDDHWNRAMLNNGKLERLYACRHCGHEGFAEKFGKHKNKSKLQCPNCQGRKGEIHK